jgi:acyl-CoA thioester hydrolase
MTDTAKLIFSTTIEPRWSDQDRLGHVNNAEFFRYFEEARIRWLDSLADQLDRSIEGPVVAATGCTYLKPIVYPCPLQCNLLLGKVGNSSLALQQTLTELASGSIMAAGTVTLVWVNRETGKPTRVPDALR